VDWSGMFRAKTFEEALKTSDKARKAKQKK
jgi:hypothetical protein